MPVYKIIKNSTKGKIMGFEEIKEKPIVRLAEIHNMEPIYGVYKGFTPGKHSKIHELLFDGDTKIRIYGCVSLDGLLNESVIGKNMKIECIDLIDVGKGHPKAIAKVSVWQD